MDENVDEQAGSDSNCPPYSSARFRTMGGPVRIAGNTLVLLCCFGLEPVSSNTGRLARAFPFRSLRAFIRDRLIFFANPLPPERLAAQAADLLRLGTPSRVDVICCGISTESVPRNFPALRTVHACVGAALPVDPSAYDTVLVAYSDPLGLGWDRLERRLLLSSRRAPLVLNGRGRVLTLTAQTRRMLRPRRLLALTRPTELVLTALVIPVAAFLALKDKLAGRA